MAVDAWNPKGKDSDLVPKGHRLDGRGGDDGSASEPPLEWTEEEQVEMRREKMRMAAEERRRIEGQRRRQ
jgi:hypothetical protein